jgi:hypothetical protein
MTKKRTATAEIPPDVQEALREARREIAMEEKGLPPGALKTSGAHTLVVTPKAMDPQALITLAIDRQADVAVIERLTDLALKLDANHARKEWHRAIAEFHRRCPEIPKSRTARIKEGFEYRFAPLDVILPIVQPVMNELGLTISWRGIADDAGKAVIRVCRISHELGHFEESAPMRIPVDVDSRMGANAAQRVGIARTYADRYSLLDIIGKSPMDDPDADGLGEGKPPVAMPKRTSEVAQAPAPEKPTDKPKAEPKPAVGDVGTWTGTISKVETGKATNNATWHKIVGADGTWFFTWHTSMGLAANGFAETVAEAVITYKVTEKGAREIVELAPLGEAAE